MSRSQHFTFSAARFMASPAHGGLGAIDAARVLERQGPEPLHFVDLVVVHPGCTIGAHEHGSDEEIYVFIAGNGEMTVDGEELPVAAGDVVVNRPGGTHSLVNTGVASLLLVVIQVSLVPSG